ncbi:hypothetical protein [Marinobacter shengliensis]|uniref:hypothetical protein n=1 Tax=Marinobacter shengliensis TaxID=1389223 RepID=UPI001E605A31|nr:hypothetical protein [Marinobacter shengliensis]MCD1628296.1 hypothetical protein [Marinobacter shengliensis]
MENEARITSEIKSCMERAGTPLSDDQYMVLAGYLAVDRQRIERNQKDQEEMISSLKLDLLQSSAQAFELARCLEECLEDVTQAITVTLHSGNKGIMKVDGRELNHAEISERLQSLKEKRSRITNALNPSKNDKSCTYPGCNCPFDMGPDHQCLRGLPVIRK